MSLCAFLGAEWNTIMKLYRVTSKRTFEPPGRPNCGDGVKFEKVLVLEQCRMPSNARRPIAWGDGFVSMPITMHMPSFM